MSADIIISYYDAFDRKDINAILNLCTEDVINDPNQGDSQSGKETLQGFLENAWAHFSEKVSDIVLMTNLDHSRVASEYRVQGTYYNTKSGLFPANNQKYDITCWAFFTIKQGKISRITRHYNTKQWLDIVNPTRV